MLFSSSKIGLITSKLHVSDFHKLSFKRNVCDVNFQGLDHILNCSIWKFSVLLIKDCHWIFPLKFGSKKWREQNIALLHTVLFVHNIHCPSLQTSSHRTIILPFLLTLGLTIWSPLANEMWVSLCHLGRGPSKLMGRLATALPSTVKLLCSRRGCSFSRGSGIKTAEQSPGGL